MRIDFIEAVKTHQAEFGLELADSKIEALADFYEIILEHTEISATCWTARGMTFAIAPAVLFGRRRSGSPRRSRRRTVQSPQHFGHDIANQSFIHSTHRNSG